MKVAVYPITVVVMFLIGVWLAAWLRIPERWLFTQYGFPAMMTCLLCWIMMSIAIAFYADKLAQGKKGDERG